MIRKSRVFVIKFVYILIDIACVYLAIFIGCYLRQSILPFSVSFHDILFDPFNPFRFIFLLWVITIVFFANVNALYQTRREVDEGFEIWLVIKSVFFSSLVVIVGIYTLKIHEFPRSIFIIIFLTMVVILSVWRILKRFFVEYLVSKGYNNFNAVIVGAGKVGLVLAEEIAQKPSLGIKVVGFLDDLKKDVEGKVDLRILGKISDFVQVSQREFINKVFITVHHDSAVFMKLLEEAQELGIAVRVIPQGFELTSGDFFKYNIGLIPILEYSDVGHQHRQTGKRLFDFMIGLITFLFIWPFFIIIGVLIKIDSQGPVFYVSKRYGKGGKIFHMLKFRSMTVDAEKKIDELRHRNEVDGPIFKIRQDPRVTKMGRFLRKYSLDELPQLINVLKGDMSLVGPRPFPIEQIEKEDLRQLKRLQVRPGITGLWQIRGRSNLSFVRLLKWDIWYINNWSFWLDLNILFQTIPVVLNGEGAY